MKSHLQVGTWLYQTTKWRFKKIFRCSSRLSSFSQLRLPIYWSDIRRWHFRRVLRFHGAFGACDHLPERWLPNASTLPFLWGFRMWLLVFRIWKWDENDENLIQGIFGRLNKLSCFPFFPPMARPKSPIQCLLHLRFCGSDAISGQFDAPCWSCVACGCRTQKWWLGRKNLWQVSWTKELWNQGSFADLTPLKWTVDSGGEVVSVTIGFWMFLDVSGSTWFTVNLKYPEFMVSNKLFTLSAAWSAIPWLYLLRYLNRAPLSSPPKKCWPQFLAVLFRPQLVNYVVVWVSLLRHQHLIVIRLLHFGFDQRLRRGTRGTTSSTRTGAGLWHRGALRGARGVWRLTTGRCRAIGNGLRQVVNYFHLGDSGRSTRIGNWWKS